MATGYALLGGTEIILGILIIYGSRIQGLTFSPVNTEVWRLGLQSGCLNSCPRFSLMSFVL